MQRALFPSYKAGHLALDGARLYADASLKPLPTVWRRYPPEAEALIRCLMRGRPFELLDPRPLPTIVTRPDSSKAVVGFSGGKDSVAATLKLRAEGLRPVLFHVRGVNRAYPGERQAAERLAAALGAPLRVLEVKLSGPSPYIENPVKNQFILACMVDYGARSGIGVYAQGGLSEDLAAEQNFEAGFSDAREMFEAAEPLMKAALPGYRYRALLKNDTDSLLTILEQAPGLLPLVQSCMMPLRYKGRLREGNERKYGVGLMPGRCGSCYKCAAEWLHLSLLGVEKPNAGFSEHSVAVLQKGLETVIGPGRYTRRRAVEAYIDPVRLPAAVRLYP